MKIIILTTGQPSTNPRMIKEVDTLIAEGNSVKVFYSFWAAWAFPMDKKIIPLYPKGTFHEVGGNPVTNPVIYYSSRIFFKAIKTVGNLFTGLKDFSLSRTSYFLFKKAVMEKADLYIAHNLGALPAAVKAASRTKGLCGFDAEDFHSGESTTGSLTRTIHVEKKYFPKLGYLTTASPLISDAYLQLFPDLQPVVINNVFSRKFLQPNIKIYNKGEVLKLFWFSQTVGTNRGIEDIIIAMAKLAVPNIQFTILGSCSTDMRQSLLELASQNNLDSNQLLFLEPVSPGEIFKIASGHHIGMAAETGHDDNRKRVLTNKIFTYILSGLAIVASNTPAQEMFIKENPNIGRIYQTNNPFDLSKIFYFFLQNYDELNNYRQNAISLADKKLNWEIESQKFLGVIQSLKGK